LKASISPSPSTGSPRRFRSSFSTGEIQRGWLGVQHTEITPESAESFGIDPEQSGTIVVKVFPGDPADVAGMEEGDVIIQVGDVRIEVSDDLNREVGLLMAGTVIDFVVIREGGNSHVDRHSRPAAERRRTAHLSGPDAGWAIPNHSSASPWAQSPASSHGILGLNSTDGVVNNGRRIGKLKADEAGLSGGDVILEFNHAAIVSVEEWNSTVSELDENDAVTLTVYRSGEIRFVIVE